MRRPPVISAAMSAYIYSGLVPPVRLGGKDGGIGRMAIVEEKKPVKKVHNLILENRRLLTVSGVSDVDSFDEETVVLYTDIGELTVKGSDLHMNKLNVETGEVNIEGTIDQLSYREENPRSSSGGLIGRIFR